MNDAYETLRALRRRYQTMDYTPRRAAVNQEYVALADRLGLPRERISGRYDLAWAYAMGDDPAKALPVCAEFFALWEDHPGAVQGRAEGPSAAMIACYVAVSLPQVPLAECEKLLERFHQQVQKAGVGERLWQLHACDFCLMTGDLAGAQVHLDRFRATPRDEISDCAACEASNAAESLLKMGRREEALETVRPVLSGALVCESQPWGVLSVLIHDALDHDDPARALAYGRQLARHDLDSPSDLVCAGALLRLSAFTAPERGAALLEPLYRADGRYACAALADWFYNAASEIAGRFDERNGYPAYQKALDAARQSLDRGEDGP